jgi:PAS domain-containing protein
MPDENDRLVSNIYLAIADRAKWRSVMSDVTAHLKADSGVFYTHDLKDADGGIWILHNIDEDVMVPYQNYYSGIDTWTNSGIEKKVVDGRLFRSQELIAQDDLRKTEHYNDFLRPNEIEHLIGFAQPTTWNGFTPRVHCSFYKKKGREPFDDSAMQLLQPLHHHLQQALTLQSLVSHSVRSFTARRLVESLCEPAFILDRDFKIVSANSAAEALFRRRDIVACKSGSLVACETRKVLRADPRSC